MFHSNYRNRLKSESFASISPLFRSECKWFLYCTAMYACSVYPTVQCQKFQNKGIIVKRELKLESFYSFLMVSSDKSALIQLQFLTVAQHKSGTRRKKIISWSVTGYNNNLSSQCNVTAQIEPIQDKYNYPALVYLFWIFCNIAG